MPMMGNLDAKFKAAFENPLVEYKQASLTNVKSIANAFTDEEGGGDYDFVINLAGETKYGQSEDVYKEKVLDVALKCAEEAKKHQTKRFIEVSTAQVYDAGKKSSTETSSTKPWTLIAKYKLEVENKLKEMNSDEFQVIFVRPALVYGPGDVAGFAPRIICGAVYKYEKEKMKFLWGSSLKTNTVHVRDLARAIVFLCEKGNPGEIYNVVDKNETDQGKTNKILEQIFEIKTGFTNVIENTYARANLKHVTEISNDKHLQPWSDLCKEQKIMNSPLTPYLDKEVLANNSLSVDGSKLENAGFTYEIPVMEISHVREIIDRWIEQGIFPGDLLSPKEEPVQA